MHVRWTPTAISDATKIGDYIAEHDGDERARNVVIAIHASAQSLSIFPNRGRLGRVHETRELILRNLPFIVVYSVQKYHVEIIRILHGAQQWPE